MKEAEKIILENKDRIIGILENGEPIVETDIIIRTSNLKGRVYV